MTYTSKNALEHLLEWPKPGTLTTPNADGDVEQQELSFIAGENANWCSHFGRQFGGLLTKLNILSTGSGNHTPWYLHKGAEIMSTQKSGGTDLGVEGGAQRGSYTSGSGRTTAVSLPRAEVQGGQLGSGPPLPGEL